MAVRLRLTRRGKKKQPTYRIVAADSRSPRDGRFIEVVGFYDPRAEPSVVKVDNEKALKWLRVGAKPSERVQKLLAISGAWEEFTGEPTPKAPPPKIKAGSKESGDVAVTQAEPDATATQATATKEATPEATSEKAPEEATATPEAEAKAEIPEAASTQEVEATPESTTAEDAKPASETPAEAPEESEGGKS